MQNRSFYRSLKSALDGILVAWRSERNFRIHTLAACMVLGIVFLGNFELWERIVLLLVTVLVLVLELANSSLERLIDLAKPRVHEYAAEAKDLMAAAVLIAALFALCVGLLLIGPKALTLLLSL